MKSPLQSTRKSAFNGRRLGTTTVLGAALFAPLFTTLPNAEAKPPQHAPAWGYRNKNKEWKKNKKQERREERNRRRSPDREVTVSGVVTRDSRGDNRFTVRLDNGRTVEVVGRTDEPSDLSRGDRVELRGDFENNLFIADSVRIISNNDNNGGNWNNQTRLSGVVTRDLSGRRFEIRTDDGRTVRVQTSDAEPVRLTRGDRVELRGRFDGSTFIARSVNITDNDDQSRVDFPGVVLQRQNSNRIIVRGDNDRIFTVNANFSLRESDRLDRVRVRGTVNGRTVQAEDVDLLRDR